MFRLLRPVGLRGDERPFARQHLPVPAAIVALQQILAHRGRVRMLTVVVSDHEMPDGIAVERPANWLPRPALLHVLDESPSPPSVL
jgi:hypothetical protein